MLYLFPVGVEEDSSLHNPRSIIGWVQIRFRESDSPEASGKESLRFRSLRRVYQNLSPLVSYSVKTDRDLGIGVTPRFLGRDEIGIEEAAGAFAPDGLVGAVVRGVVGRGANTDLLDVVLGGQLGEAAIEQLQEQGEVYALPVPVVQPEDTRAAGLQRLGEIEVDPVLVSPFRPHPRPLDVLGERGLHLETPDGEIGSLHPLLQVERLDGRRLHVIPQGGISHQLGEDNRHGPFRRDTELREDHVPYLTLPRHVFLGFYPFLFKDLSVILREGGRPAESLRQQRDEEYPYNLYVHFSIPDGEVMIHTSLSCSFLKASG